VAVKISVIIPAFNEERLLDGTLQRIRAALPAFGARAWETEIIVCDNNSTDRTAEIARAGGATVVFEPVNQIGRARNRGAAAATGDWLLFVDADSHPTPELFGDVADTIATGHCLAGGSTVYMPTDRLAARTVTEIWNSVSRLWRWVAGSFIFCEAAAFRQLGGFDEKLYASEEIDLSKRLKRLAWETGREVVILDRHPLLTSPRKLHLYSDGEHLRFALRALLGGGRALTRREDCLLWYDGRR
jgi:glycosyltransferase involved in cell wall biosynthesis